MLSRYLFGERRLTSTGPGGSCGLVAVQMLDIQQPTRVRVLGRQDKRSSQLELTSGDAIRFEADSLPTG